MHSAPSVNYPVGRCRFFAVLLWLQACTALGLITWWWAVSANDPSSIQRFWSGLGSAFWLAWGFWSVRYWRQSPEGRLEWDAQAPSATLQPDDARGAWLWWDAASTDATRLNSVEVALDLQTRVLLRLPGTWSQGRWIWVERWRDPARWDDLRRALHSSGA